MNPRKWRVRKRGWGTGWWAIDPRHVFLCGPGDNCLKPDTFAEAIAHADKAAREA